MECGAARTWTSRLQNFLPDLSLSDTSVCFYVCMFYIEKPGENIPCSYLIFTLELWRSCPCLVILCLKDGHYESLPILYMCIFPAPRGVNLVLPVTALTGLIGYNKSDGAWPKLVHKSPYNWCLTLGGANLFSGSQLPWNPHAARKPTQSSEQRDDWPAPAVSVVPPEAHQGYEELMLDVQLSWFFRWLWP